MLQKLAVKVAGSGQVEGNRTRGQV